MHQLCALFCGGRFCNYFRALSLIIVSSEIEMQLKLVKIDERKTKIERRKDFAGGSPARHDNHLYRGMHTKREKKWTTHSIFLFMRLYWPVFVISHVCTTGMRLFIKTLRRCILHESYYCTIILVEVNTYWISVLEFCCVFAYKNMNKMFQLHRQYSWSAFDNYTQFAWSPTIKTGVAKCLKDNVTISSHTHRKYSTTEKNSVYFPFFLQVLVVFVFNKEIFPW